MVRYVPRPGVMARELGDETVILDTVSGTYFRLNDTGTRLWSRLTSPVSAEMLADHLAGVYGVSRDVVLADVVELLDELHECGLVAVAE